MRFLNLHNTIYIVCLGLEKLGWDQQDLQNLYQNLERYVVGK